MLWHWVDNHPFVDFDQENTMTGAVFNTVPLVVNMGHIGCEVGVRHLVLYCTTIPFALNWFTDTRAAAQRRRPKA